MQKNNITILGFLFVMLSVFSCKKDTDSYKMPYEPGITIDKESFLKHKELWDTTSIQNYSYTYSFYNSSLPCDTCVIDVVITNGIVSKYDVKEFNKMPVSEIPESELIAYEGLLWRIEQSQDFLLINNIYSTINEAINNSFEEIKEYPDCYYANYSFEFSDTKPFMSRCFYTVSIMQEQLVGNGAEIEFKIENFKEN